MSKMHFLRIACLLIAHEFWKYTVIAEFSAPAVPLVERPEEELLDLIPINNTDNFRSITKDTSGKPWDDQVMIRCLRPSAKCEKLLNTTCYDGKLPYKFTSSQLTSEQSQDKNLNKLYQLEALKYVPKCWALIQPFLCAVYLPKCTRVKGREYVYLPSFEMCRVTSEPCRILYDTDFFPPNLKCDRKIWSCDNCRNDVREVKFNAMGQCMSPLIPTESSINHYPAIEGCGLQCKDPMYTDEEHLAVHALIFYGTIVCFICNLFVIATFLIHDWKHSKHPAWNLFYISICFLCNWIGWALQFLPGHRENIVCRRDGTLRHSEPSAGENLACIIPFILIYYFLIAANIWFAIFTYAWYLQTKDRGSIRSRIEKHQSESFYFHFIAWALPFILTVSIMVLSEVDGNSITGICFVGYRNRTIRSSLVLVPVAILSFGVSVFFAFKGALNLNRIKRSTTNSEESKKLSSHILGFCFRTMLIVFFIFAFFVFESYEVRNTELWTKSLNDLIICRIKESHLGDMTKCKLQNHPSVAVLQLRLLCLFCVNLVISSWCWTWPALKTWKRFIRKKIGYELSEDEKFTKPKHRIIADAYAKRMDDVISVSIQNSHTDPAGLNFDMNNLNAAQSDAMDPTLTNYLRNIINRRNAVTMTTMDFNEPTTNCAAYTSSCADNNSEISVSVRHFSVESRRNSIDSQVSVKMSETNIKATLESHSQKHKRVNVKAKKSQRNYLYNKRTNRRASSSSVESQRITNQTRAFKYRPPSNRIQLSSMGRQSERRSAVVAANDFNDIHLMLNRNNMATTSDDDQSNDESNPMLTANEHSNMLVPLGAPHQQQMVDSVDSLDASNGQDTSFLDEKIMEFIRSNSGKQLESFLRNNYDRSNDRSKNGLHGIAKNGRSSLRNSKNQRHSHNKMFLQQKGDAQPFTSKIMKNDNDMGTSMSSSMDIDIIQHLDGTRSSFSDQSINRMKTQSQNSKSSCDVGIQANDYDIASHTHRIDDCNKDKLIDKIQLNYQQHEDYANMETDQLLPFRKPPSIVRKDNIITKHLSESEKKEKLFKLLMPSTELN